MKVAIKFCGGCDPAYDRAELFQRIKSLAGDSIEWLRVEEQGYEAILLVCGCATACPEEEFGQVSGLVSIKHKEPFPERVVARLLGKGRSDANQD